MTATRINRKRSHDDVDDGDESLPISKRINSLHLEGQVQVIGHHQQVPVHNQMNPFNNSWEEIASTSSALITNQSQGVYGQNPTVRNLDLTGHLSTSNMSDIPGHLLPISDGASNLSYSPLHFNAQLSTSESQMAHSHMMYPSSAEIDSFPGQYAMYHQRHPYHQQLLAHSPLSQAYSCHSQPQSNMDLAAHNISSYSINSMGVLENPEKCDNFNEQQRPQGPYAPELGVSENPHYFSANRILYEAHLKRMQRTT